MKCYRAVLKIKFTTYLNLCPKISKSVNIFVCCFAFLTVFDDCQVVLLSATMPVEVLDVTKRFMRDPIRILVKKEELTLEGIRQFYVFVDKEVSRIILFSGIFPFLLRKSTDFLLISYKMSAVTKK